MTSGLAFLAREAYTAVVAKEPNSAPNNKVFFIYVYLLFTVCTDWTEIRAFWKPAKNAAPPKECTN
jgi:hypothetical protein